MAENRELALVLKLVADQFQSELKKSGGALGEFNSFIKDWKTQLAAAGAALFAVAKSTANYGDELVKASQRMGTTVEDTARLQHAARLSDTDLQGLSKTVGVLSKTMYESASGNAEARDKFDRLGISATTATGQLKSTTDVLLELNDKFRLMPDGPEKTALALLTLGKTGKDVLPLLNSNMREAFTEAEQLGLVMSEKAAKAGEHFNDELTKLSGAVRGVTNDVGGLLIPKLDTLTHALTQIVTDAHAAANALTGLNKADAPTVGVVKPAEGGRNLRVLPAPPDVDKAAPMPFFQTEGQAKEQEAIGKRLVESFVGQYRVGVTLGKEQEALGKALLEIHQADYRSIDIANKQRTEGADAYTLSLQRQIQMEDIEAQSQEQRGQSIMRQTQVEVAIRDSAAAKERDGLVQNLQAWQQYYQAVGGSSEFRYTNELNMVRATLAQQTQLTQDESARLLMAWQNHDEQLATEILNRTTLTEQQRETIMLQSLAHVQAANDRASDDVVAGWAKGMQRYVADTQSGFGLAADMARRTAQEMEQGFRNFFFDLFDGRIQTFKDGLRGLLNFVKQVAAQIAAQLAVSFALKSAMGMGGMFTGMDTGWVNNIGEFFGMDFTHKHSGGLIEPARYAIGGHVLGTGNRDTVPALLTPGEGVLSRRGMAALDSLNNGNRLGVGQANITVNIQNAPAESTALVNQRRVADGLVLDVIFRNRQGLRPLLGGA